MLSRVWIAAAAACLIGCGSASAQSVGDARARSSADWRRLSQSDLNCVEQALRARRSNLRGVMQSGIGPNDALMAPIRAECRIPVRSTSQPRSASSGTQALASVDTEAARRAAEKASAEKAAAEKAAAQKAAAERIAAVEKAAEKAAAEKAAAEKIAAVEKAAAEKAAALKAVEDKIAAEKAAAQQAAEEKAASDRIAAAKAATDKAATDKAAADRAARDESAAKELAEKATVAAAKTATEPAAEPIQPPEPEHPPQDMAHASTDSAQSHSVRESQISFIYGLIIGPVIFCFGGVVFSMVGRRNGPAAMQIKPDTSASNATDHAAHNDRAAFDRLVSTVAAELNRRNTRPPDHATREQRTEDAGLH